jgi:hypothetical protein
VVEDVLRGRVGGVWVVGFGGVAACHVTHRRLAGLAHAGLVRGRSSGVSATPFGVGAFWW